MHDTQCNDLARIFLNDEAAVTEAEVNELADDIQRTIEDFLQARAARQA